MQLPGCLQAAHSAGKHRQVLKGREIFLEEMTQVIAEDYNCVIWHQLAWDAFLIQWKQTQVKLGFVDNIQPVHISGQTSLTRHREAGSRRLIG